MKNCLKQKMVSVFCVFCFLVNFSCLAIAQIFTLNEEIPQTVSPVCSESFSSSEKIQSVAANGVNTVSFGGFSDP